MNPSIHDLFREPSLHEFITGYWEARPLHMNGSRHGLPLADLFSFANLEKILALLAIPGTAYQDQTRVEIFHLGERIALAQLAGSPVEWQSPTRRAFFSEGLVSAIRKGARIDFIDIDKAIPAIGRLLAQVEKALSCTASARAVLCPGNVRREDTGVPANTREQTGILLFQIHGQQTLQLHATAPGPASADTPRQYRIHPGDILYIPRRTLAAAEPALAAEPNLCIHIALAPLRWIDVIEALILAPEVADALHGALPAGFIASDSDDAALAATLEQHMQTATQAARPRAALDAVRGQWFKDHEHRPAARGYLRNALDSRDQDPAGAPESPDIIPNDRGA